jgi:hypothetical protein
MCQSGNCSKCNKCNPCSCGEQIPHFFVKVLPAQSKRCPRAMYFVKSDGEVSTYITDDDKNAYLIGGGGGSGSDINIISPLNTIIVTRIGDTFRIDVSGSTGGEDNIINSITFNGSILTPDVDKNVTFEAVESVSGNIVDNTDPYNPIVNLTPEEWDLEQFTNEGEDPYLKQSDLGNIEHNTTSNKQGGDDDLDEFYHLTENEHGYLTDVVSNDTIGKILEVIAEPPVYIAPNSSITNVTQTAEIGSTVSIAITQTFTQNDAGSKISETIKKNGSTVSTTSTFNETLTVQPTQTVYSGTVSYAEGVTKNNNLDIPDPTGKILAGTVNSSNRTITPIYPIFYGAFNSQPNATALNFTGMTKQVASGQNTVTVSVGSTSSQWVVVAIPSSYPIKNKWFITELNQGAIGGSSNLFGTPTVHSKSSPNGFWGGVSYRIYITNYASAIGTIQLRNS